MKSRHKVSRAGIDLIKTFEGYRRSAARLADGRWTIGYGHTKFARQGAEVSEADASALLAYDLIEISASVNALTFTPLTQNQFDALVSFASNIGVAAFRRSKVLRRINEGSMLQAATALEMWRKADFEGEEIVVDALVRRRAAEKTLFLTPSEGWVAAPSPVLPPKFDAVGQATTPVDLRTSLVGETATVVREESPMETPSSQFAEATDTLLARLESILPAAEAAETVETQPDPFPEISQEPVVHAELAPEPAASEPPVQEPVRPEPVAFSTGEPVKSPEAVAETALFPQPIYREQPRQDYESARKADAAAAKSTLLFDVLLALLGLVIFVMAVTWAFSAHGAGGAISPRTIGAPLAALGICCMAWSVYSLISRFSSRED